MLNSSEYLLYTADQDFRRLRRINRIQLVMLLVLASMLVASTLYNYDKVSVDPKPPVKIVIDKPAAKSVPTPRVR